MTLGVGAFLAIVYFSDVGLIIDNSGNLGLIGVVLLMVVTLALQSVSFAVVGRMEFHINKGFWFFWAKSVQASVANVGFPLSGSVSKIAQFKSRDGIRFQDSLRAVVNVAAIRFFVLTMGVIFFSPLAVYAKLSLSAALLGLFSLWVLVGQSLPILKNIQAMQPAKSLKIPTKILVIMTAEILVILIGSLSLLIIASSIGQNLTVGSAILIQCGGSLIALIPLTPLGLGTRDVFLVSMLAGLGAGLDVATTIAVTERALLLLALLVIWILVSVSLARKPR